MKTDGGSNMVANTFDIPIPGWETNDTDTLEESRNSQIADSVALDEEVSSEHSPEPSDESDVYIELEFFVNDNEDEEETKDILLDFELSLPSPLSTASVINTDRASVLNSSLRTNCVAHSLQLVVKDGLAKLQVI